MDEFSQPPPRPTPSRQQGNSVIQAMGFSLFGLLILVIDNLALGPIVDYFIDLGTTFEIINPTMMDTMQTMMFFGNWFYYIIFIIGCVFVIFPILWAIARHKYGNADTLIMDEQSQF